MSDAKGLYNKFAVIRLDNSSEHKNCDYFVLDLDHDQHALIAIQAYANSCQDESPLLAEDLRNKLHEKLQKYL